MSDLENLLKINNLAKYFKLFANQNINTIKDFKGLYYTDLEKLGITDIKSKRLIYDLICEVKEKTYEKSFLTEILLTKENNYVNAENQKSMNEQETANTSKLVDLKYSNKHMNETKESNSQLLLNERNCVETTVRQPASSSTQEDLNKSIYEARYGDRIDSSINNEEVNKIPPNDTFINYTNLFYNSSHIPQSPAPKKDKTLISSIFYKKSDTKVTKEIAENSVQLVENVSCNLLQKIKLSDNSMQRIIVCVRKKPVNKGEKDVVECEKQSINVREIKTNYDLTKKVHCHTFNYDFAYDENAKNDDLYKDISNITEHVINGGNGSVIAYGQTGTGKTHTMLHPENGLVFLGLREFLSRGKQVYISFFEIYNGQLYDLLDYREKVIVREKNHGVYIQNITERKINTFEEGRMVINDGMSIRRRGVTGANIESSRSHAVLKIALDKDSNTSEGNCMLFVDLAGSERGNDRKNVDDYTKNEGAEINKSLLALKECIRSLVNSESHLTFRHTKLTQILKNSFIGNGMTCLVATINPSGSCIEHTLNTLKYANRVKDIKPSGKLRLHIQSNEKTDGSISKSVTQLSTYFDKKVDGKRNTNIDDFGHKSVHSSSLGRDSTNESRYMSTIARRNVTDANLVVLLNKKIENTTKIIVKQCSTSSDIRMLKRTSDYLKRIETKINEMKFL